MDYKALFQRMHPGFFDKEYIRKLNPKYVFDEQILALKDFCPSAVDVPVPEGITFGFFQGEFAKLQAAVREVEDDWAQYFGEEDRVFCAFQGEKVVSFCLLDGMGEYDFDGRHIRIAGPGCVGTIPAYRKKGIGLKMVQLATEILKKEGYDYSYIHYTAVGHWYGYLGYRTILQWNAKGILDE